MTATILPWLKFAVCAALIGDGAYGLPMDDIGWFREHYLPNRRDWNDRRSSPGVAEDVRELPPILIIFAAYDALRDEGIAFAGRLKTRMCPSRCASCQA